jgi:hypothetical protein
MAQTGVNRTWQNLCRSSSPDERSDIREFMVPAYRFAHAGYSLFEVDRKAQKDSLKILCCNEYTMALTAIQRGLNEFGAIDIFYIGGGWCGYTKEAKEYCLTQKMGIFVSNEMSGALWKDDHWTYHQRDQDGNPIYYYRVAAG